MAAWGASGLGGRLAIALASSLVLAGSPQSSKAGEFDAFDDIERVGAYEIWAGADAAANTWLAYSGVTVAPWGDTHADGFRIRATSGVGRYRYDYDHATRVTVNKAVADLSLGYQTAIDTLTLKVFLGWAVLAREFAASSLAERASRLDQGVKAAAELWLDWSEVSWGSLDVGFADTRSTLDLRVRLGQRLENDVSAGVEGLFNHQDLSGEVLELAGRQSLGNGRVGLFVRYDWFGGEASLAGGVSTDVIDRKDQPLGASRLGISKEVSPYGALTVLFQF